LWHRAGDGSLEVLLGHPGGPYFAKKDADVWSILKGEYDSDEDPFEVAKREFFEESGHSAPDSAAANHVVGCVFRHAAGSQHTTTRRAPHALRRWRQIRPTLVAQSALASRSIAARRSGQGSAGARGRAGRRGWRGKRSRVLTSADAPGTRRPVPAIPARQRNPDRFDARHR